MHLNLTPLKILVSSDYSTVSNGLGTDLINVSGICVFNKYCFYRENLPLKDIDISVVFKLQRCLHNHRLHCKAYKQREDYTFWSANVIKYESSTLSSCWLFFEVISFPFKILSATLKAHFGSRNSWRRVLTKQAYISIRVAIMRAR